MTNTIRPGLAMTLQSKGGIQTWAEIREPFPLGGQRRSDGRTRQVDGDGMHGRWCGVNHGNLPGIG